MKKRFRLFNIFAHRQDGGDPFRQWTAGILPAYSLAGVLALFLTFSFS
jgi:hypothetical protein